ncbi:hypothetical protein ACLB2K_068848 [Fragaria x ananassa]
MEDDGNEMEAVKVMDEMEDNGVGAKEVTYGVMIEGYCKGRGGRSGKVEDACKLWRRLLKKNRTPDNAVLGTLIYWLCKKGELWKARKLFDQFETSDLRI